MGNVVSLSEARSAPKSVQSRMETLIVTQDMVNDWRLPPFQRPLRVNEKVRALTERVKTTENIDGVITLGKIKNDTAHYVVDGQHRIEGFRLSGLEEAIADIRIVSFDDMAEMSEEFVNLNSALVKMRPDDILRGLESSVPPLKAIRRSCEFVGYDHIRRGTSSPILSMSALLRCWAASTFETPAGSSAGMSAQGLAKSLDQLGLQNMTAFLSTAHAAWGRDPEYHKLWGNLNLALCMWLWNRMVIDRDRSGNKRYAVLSVHDFKKCLMSVSADGDYLSWLPGRTLSDRDRSPAYRKLKGIFSRRLSHDHGGQKFKLPLPAWASK